ncbi:hypothetical protein [Geobacillus subterraneus]|uniref:hypothetical protein n=1 Tax=Geobacillus subterraneus TaxID=129338 RepID=UPI0016121C89
MGEMIAHVREPLKGDELLIYDSSYLQAVEARPFGDDLRAAAVCFLQVSVSFFKLANGHWIDSKHLDILGLRLFLLVEKHRRMLAVD